MPNIPVYIIFTEKKIKLQKVEFKVSALIIKM